MAKNKFHISPKTGQPEECNASVRACNYAHFDSRKEAQEKINELLKPLTMPQGMSKSRSGKTAAGDATAQRKLKLQELRRKEAELENELKNQNALLSKKKREFDKIQQQHQHQEELYETAQKTSEQLSPEEQEKFLELSQKLLSKSQIEVDKAEKERQEAKTARDEVARSLKELRKEPELVIEREKQRKRAAETERARQAAARYSHSGCGSSPRRACAPPTSVSCGPTLTC